MGNMRVLWYSEEQVGVEGQNGKLDDRSVRATAEVALYGKACIYPRPRHGLFAVQWACGGRNGVLARCMEGVLLCLGVFFP